MALGVMTGGSAISTSRCASARVVRGVHCQGFHRLILGQRHLRGAVASRRSGGRSAEGNTIVALKEITVEASRRRHSCSFLQLAQLLQR